MTDIAIVPGDGSAREVVEATVPVVEDVFEQEGIEATLTWYDWGRRHYLETGSMTPDGWLEELRRYDAILHGATGDADIDEVTPVNFVVRIRQAFDQYINLRPITLFEGVASPIRGYAGGEIRFDVYRENTEGEYVDVDGRVHQGFEREVALQTVVVSGRVRSASSGRLSRRPLTGTDT
jgi:tartrate dehydrogenase/decarboxylase/D-malate dehydrogenase